MLPPLTSIIEDHTLTPMFMEPDARSVRTMDMDTRYAHIKTHTEAGTHAEWLARMAMLQDFEKIYGRKPEIIMEQSMHKIRSHHQAWAKYVGVGRAVVASMYASEHGVPAPGGFIAWPSELPAQRNLTQQVYQRLELVASEIRVVFQAVSRAFAILHKQSRTTSEMDPLVWARPSFSRLIFLIENLASEMEMLARQLRQFCGH